MSRKRLKQVAYQFALGVNELVDRGLCEKITIISEKMFEGELVDYILNKYKDKDIMEFEFSDISIKVIPELEKLFSQFGANVVYGNEYKYYGIKTNGLVLISSVVLHMLNEEF